MREQLKLPRRGRTAEYFADYTLRDEGERIVATDGWITAPHRGTEIMNEIAEEFQRIARRKRKPVVHRYEAATLQGRKLIHKFPQYQWVERSYEGYPVYEYTYEP